MANSYYTHGSTPIALSQGSSGLIRAEFDLIEDGFDKFVTFSGNGGRVVVVNAAGTFHTVTTGDLTLAGNFATTGSFNTTFVQQATGSYLLPMTSQTLLTVEMIQGQIWGLHMNNNAGDATNDVDIYRGVAASDEATPANVVLMNMTGDLTKRLDATWASGTNQGGRATNASGGVIANTTYHVFLILVGSTVDVGFDDSVTGANLIADHSATKVRRIGSIIRSGGTILGFTQRRDHFFLHIPIASIEANNPGTAAVTGTLNTPVGVVNYALITCSLYDATPTVAKAASVTALTQTDSSASVTSVFNVATDATDSQVSGHHVVATNTSSQIRYRLSVSDADITFRINTVGWIDTRNRYG